MSILLAVILFGLSLCAIGTGTFYAIVLVRLVRTQRMLPTARSGIDLPPPEGGWPSLCIVVPAHNEEDVIAELTRSLVAQSYPNLSIVFALDRCTDGTQTALTQAITDESGAIDRRFEIITIDNCPDGWSGKTNAVHQGVTRSRGAADAALLLFTDADTEFHPELCQATVALLRHRGLSLLSLLSRLNCEHWYERLVQPAAGFELIREYPLDIINSTRRPRAFANGQFMLFDRTLYDAVGGHELVKDRILEDIAFAREINRKRSSLGNPKWGVYMSGGMLRCHMYRSWPAFIRGWKRIYTESAGRRPTHLRKWSLRHRLTGSILPTLTLVALAMGTICLRLNIQQINASIAIITSVVAIIVYLLAMVRVYGSQGVSPVWVLTYPLGAWLASNIQARAGADLVAGKTTHWGGIEYQRKVRT